jgi:cysteinyl-tRNA synthetase
VTIRIHDTIERKKVPLTLRDAGAVSIYVCGPTVYDVPHVGHGRFAVAFDVVRRYLEWSGLAVRYVSNVTDVEDKIIARAAEAGSTESELARQSEDAWWAAMDRLDVRKPDDIPHATEYIARMLELIAELIDTDHAYVVDGSGVYFDVPSFPSYGALPHRTIEQLLDSAGARVDVDEGKRTPIDFVLWKAAKPGEPAWDSPWGPGRPGWHIECSAMSLDLLGEGFDLHGAGNDLVFPHHENERAQAEAAGHPFARHWIHSGMVEVGGQKMSKSLGNFQTLDQALDQHGSRAFRLAVLQTQYRKDMELGPSELADAAKAVARLDTVAVRAANAGVTTDGAPLDEATMARFRAEMDDDFGTPGAVGAIFDAANMANQAIDAGETVRAASLLATVRELAGALGLEVDATTGAVDDPEAEQLRHARAEARASKDFAAADQARAELIARGYDVEDLPDGTTQIRRRP